MNRSGTGDRFDDYQSAQNHDRTRKRIEKGSTFTVRIPITEKKATQVAQASHAVKTAEQHIIRSAETATASNTIG